MSTDALHRFLFTGLPVRGALVRITAGWREALARRATVGSFPAPVRNLLGEMAAAGLLLHSSIKFDGAQTDRGNPATMKLAQLAGIESGDVVLLAGSTQHPEEALALALARRINGDQFIAVGPLDGGGREGTMEYPGSGASSGATAVSSTNEDALASPFSAIDKPSASLRSFQIRPWAAASVARW